MIAPLLVSLLALPVAPQAPDQQGGPPEITTATLIDELADLERLTRLRAPAYRVRQFSSTDRRSRAPGEEGWFSNADGFGGEPIPGFEQVLREPADDGIGLYLVCDVEGPGAIVRGWSAGMGGRWTVWLDGDEQPVFEGSGYDFLARRSRFYLEAAGVELDCGDALVQQDADYLPMPFARRCRITWEGKLKELHFYQLEVRRWAPGTKVRTFAGGESLRAALPQLERAVEALVSPTASAGAPGQAIDGPLDRGRATRSVRIDGPGALTELRIRLEAEDPAKALRGVLLRISFDGAERPQVLAPLGDFFGSGVGVNPYDSLPMSVLPDGTMVSRWVMPWAESCELAIVNTLPDAVAVHATPWIVDRPWDDDSLHFHARWRHDPAIDLVDKDPIDLTFLDAKGKGRLVGVASILLNPSPVPTPWGNWWGEGDEKVFVDGEDYPSFLGTGSEDYYNYSWSRPDLFDHPYCGQPLDTGPGNSGHVVNYRWHVLDDVPFDHSLRFDMELWHHRALFPISYARMAYWYARPGGSDDFREPSAAELEVPKLPTWEPASFFGSRDSFFLHLEDVVALADGRVAVQPEPLSSRHRVLHWRAKAGDSITFPVAAEKDGDYALNLVVRHRPDGATVKVLLDGEELPLDNAGGSGASRRGDREVPLTTRFVPRLLSLGFEKRSLTAGAHTVTIACVADGDAAFDYAWVQTRR